MVIDFKKIEEISVMNFKGGHGELLTRNYEDGKCRIMFSRLRPGAASGLHSHERNSEVVYVISGEATFHCDGAVETVLPGQVHYCPEGHSHYMENNTGEELVYLAIVPEHY